LVVASLGDAKMYSPVFPLNLLSLRPDILLALQAAAAARDEGLTSENDANDNNHQLLEEEKEEEEEEIDDDEPSLSISVEKQVTPKRVRISDISTEPKVYTDNINEMCLVRCKLCDKTLAHGSLRDHLLRSHNRKRQEFVTYEYVRVTHYRCKLCNGETLFTHAAISQHVRIYHSLTFSEYKNKFNGFTSGDTSTQSSTDTETHGSVQEVHDDYEERVTPIHSEPRVTPILVPLNHSYLEEESLSEKKASQRKSTVKEISFDNSLLAEHSLEAFMPTNHSSTLLQHLLRNQLKPQSPPHRLSPKDLSAHPGLSIHEISPREQEEDHSISNDQPHYSESCPDAEVDSDDDDEYFISPMEFCDAKLDDLDDDDENDVDNDDDDITCDADQGSSSMLDQHQDVEMHEDEDNENTLEEDGLSTHPQKEEREDGEVRIVTDNLNEMCEFECLLCGASLVESTLSKHLKEVHNECRREGFTHKYKRLTYYKCKICQKEITFYFAALREHMLTRHNLKMPEYRAQYQAFSNERIVSDHLKDMCVCKCNICDQTFLHHKMKKHMKYKHNSTTRNLYTFIKQTYYRCKICFAEVLFSFDSIRNHLWNHHQLPLKDYKNSCQAFTGELESELPEPELPESELPEPELPEQQDLDVEPPQHQVVPPMPKLKNYSQLAVSKELQQAAALMLGGAFLPNLQQMAQQFNASRSEHLATLLLNNAKPKTFSDKLSDMTVCRCRVCKTELHHHLLKKHFKAEHSCNLTKNQYEFVVETHYRCKICNTGMLFSFDTIRRHVYQSHRLSLKEYRRKHNAFTEEQTPEGVPEENKTFSDDPKDMCICACKVCGEEYLHHLIMKHIRKKHAISSKDQYKFTKLIYYKCKVCGIDFPFSMLNISNHLIQNHKLTMTEYKRTYPAFSGVEGPPPPPKEEEKEKIFSDNLEERCICRCAVCGKEMYQDRLGKHAELNHKDQKPSLQGGRNEFVLKTYHRCKICHSELLFNLQGIRKHVRRAHDLSMDEYKENYSPFTGGSGIRKGRPAKKNRELKKKKKSAGTEGNNEEVYMFHAMDDNELEGKQDAIDVEDPDFDPTKIK